MMKKLRKDEKLYIKEMAISLKQTESRLASCASTIKHLQKGIGLEKDQAAVIVDTIRVMMLTYRKWRKGKGLPPLKSIERYYTK